MAETKKMIKKSNRKRNTKKTEKIESSEERIRVCLKNEPLTPLNTGAVKIKKGKTCNKKVTLKRPSLVIKKNFVSRNSNVRKELASSSRPSSSKRNAKSKKQKPQLRGHLPTIKEEESAEELQSGVVFNPRVGCQACEEGRKGEGDASCWACRLQRLQTITERVHTTTKNIK